jgi:hypothetical protein
MQRTEVFRSRENSLSPGWCGLMPVGRRGSQLRRPGEVCETTASGDRCGSSRDGRPGAALGTGAGPRQPADHHLGANLTSIELLKCEAGRNARGGARSFAHEADPDGKPAECGSRRHWNRVRTSFARRSGSRLDADLQSELRLMLLGYRLGAQCPRSRQRPLRPEPPADRGPCPG